MKWYNKNMERRTKIIIIVVVGVFLIAGVAGWWYWNQQSIEQIDQQYDEEATGLPRDVVGQSGEPQVSETGPQQFSAEVVARLFAERFGSFTNVDNFAGISLVESYITPSFGQWYNSNYRSQLQERYPGPEYGGETVKVLGVDMLSEEDVQAVASVRTQRTVSTSVSEDVRYQTLRLDMIKTGDAWLVDGAFWE